jgi:hypothetical protein
VKIWFALLFLAAGLIGGELHVLEGQLENAKDCVRLEWENQDGLRSAIEVAAQWRTLVPVALGENEYSVTATYRDGSTRQQRFGLWGRQRGKAREIAGQVMFRGHFVPYTIEDGQVVVEDHILLGPVAEVIGENGTGKNGQRGALVIANAGSRWTNNTVVYLFDSALPEASRDKFLRAAAFWQANTQLRFVERTNQTNYQRISRRVPDDGACFSNVGMRSGESLMQLPDSCPQSAVTHELGHTIGLYHEQSRLDRDQQLVVDVSRARLEQGSQFVPQVENGVSAGPYDYGSIMHYAEFQFGRGAEAVLRSIPRGIELADAEPTIGDLEAVRQLYGATQTETWITTNPAGLEIEVDGVKAQSPQRYRWADGTRHEVKVSAVEGSGDTRVRFARWSNDGPMAQTITAGPSTRMLSAHFIRQYRMPVGFGSPAEGGGVTVTPYASDGYYDGQTEVTFEAQAAEGLAFARWNYLGLGSRNPATVRVTAAFTAGPVRPIFTRRRLITIQSDPPGRLITVDGQRWTTPVRFDWAEGTQHTLAAADQDVRRIQYDFLNWSQGGAASQTVRAGAESTEYVAHFRTRYLLTRQTNGNGSVVATPASTDGYYDAGTVVTLTATPAAGGTFRNWFGSVSGTQPTVTVTLSDERLAVANFGLAAPTISASHPTIVMAGVAPFAWRLAGTNLIDGQSVVRVNGSVRPGRFTGVTYVEIPLTAADLVAGELVATVTNGTLAPATARLTVRPRAGNCTIALETASVNVAAAGGAVSIPLTTGAGCTWALSTTSTWIEAPPGGIVGGPGFAYFFVEPNPLPQTRSATLRVGEQTIAVVQAAQACAPGLPEAAVELPGAGGATTIDVGLWNRACLWNLSADAEWVTLSASTTQGMGQLTLRAEANSGLLPRSANVRLAEGVLRVVQASTVVPRVDRVVSEADSLGGVLGRQSRVVIEGEGLAAESGVRVLFGEVAGFVLETSPGRVVVQVPVASGLGDVPVRVFNGGSFTEAVMVAIAEIAPRAYAPKADNEIEITGFGITEPELRDGEAAGEGAKPQAPVVLLVEGTEAEIVSATLVAGEAGRLRIVFRAPSVAAGEARAVVRVGTVESAAFPVRVAN